jgi:hypothetical protein
LGVPEREQVRVKIPNNRLLALSSRRYDVFVVAQVASRVPITDEAWERLIDTGIMLRDLAGFRRGTTPRISLGPKRTCVIKCMGQGAEPCVAAVWRKKVSSKVAHVIIVGLNEEERQTLDKKTLEILHFVDASWQYHSHPCDTIDNAFELAEKLQNIDIIYIGRREPSITLSAENDHILALYARFKGSRPPVISYPYGDGVRHKLPAAIMSLWKDRNKTSK